MNSTLLELLWSVPAVSGNETELGIILDDYMKNNCLWQRQDSFGNHYYGIGSFSHVDVAIVAHMDEIGLIISSALPTGLLLAEPRGLLYPSQYFGQQIKIRTNHKDIFGTAYTTHKMQKNHMFNPFMIDIGANDVEDAMMQVCLGDCAIVDLKYKISSNGFIIGRGLDNKIGVYLALELIKGLYNSMNTTNTCIILTTGEEISSGNAKKAVEGVHPDKCIIIDAINDTCYTKMDRTKYGNISIGRGPVLHGCGDLEIKGNYQKYGSGLTNTEFDDIQSVVECTILLGYPIKYMHTMSEMVSVNDVITCRNMLYSVVAESDR